MTATGRTKNAQHADCEATHTTAVKRKEKEIFTAEDVTDTHTVMPHVQDNATQVPPDSNTKAITHPGQTITQSHQQSQTTTISTTTTTTTQGHHQHPPVLEAMRTSPSNS